MNERQRQRRGGNPASVSPDPPVATEESEALTDLRREIDAVDGEILEALNRRAAFVQQVGELKRSERTGVYRSGRERDLVARLVDSNPGPFPSSGIRPVFREIISATRSLEARLRIAYLGPEGTFSQVAAREAFGENAAWLPVTTIADVFEVVERGEADHGIVPVENTTEGVVTATLDTLLASSSAICAERLLPISLHLMAQSRALDEIETVVSHPQPLAQCRIWLDRHLGHVPRQEVASTAAAAKLAREQPGVAAIGSALLVEHSGLETVASAIEDRRDNTTRFLVIGGEPPPPSGSDLTVAAFTVRKGESGALYKLLEPFAKHGVNLTSIQARPMKGTPWEYVFFVDLEGHISEARVKRGLEEAATRAHSYRVLGSFPRAAGSSP